MLTLFLLVAALVCFGIAACSVPTGRVHTGWLGAVLVCITWLIAAWPGHV